MKKTILVVLLLLMVATPCLAEEMHPEGIFSIEETEWQALPIGLQIFPLPWIEFKYDLKFGFYGGEVYPDLQPVDKSFYIDLLVFSIFGTGYSMSNNLGPVTTSAYFGILQPIGIGTVVVSTYQCCFLPLPTISIALLTKTDENWTPSPEFGSIAPEDAVQEMTLQVTVTCLNTTFQDGTAVSVQFSPPEGLTTSNISVVSNTELEFDLEIAADAPLGRKSVIVTYGNPTKSVTGNVVFEVSDTF